MVGYVTADQWLNTCMHARTHAHTCTDQSERLTLTTSSVEKSWWSTPLSQLLTTNSSLTHPEPAALSRSHWCFESVSLPWLFTRMSEPHTLHPAALPMVTIQMRKPACSNLDPKVTRLLNNHCWCLESNECQCVTKTQYCLRLYLCPVCRITTAAINIKLSSPIWHLLFLPSQPLFLVTTTSPRCPYPLWGAMTAGPGLDWGAHLWCSPGSPRAGRARTQAWQPLTKCNFLDFCRL